MQDIQAGLVAVKTLSEEQKTEITALQLRCEQAEGLRLVLYQEPPRQPDTTAQFLYYQDNRLVGFVCLEGIQTPEVTVMVHPGYRRRGIGYILLQAAITEVQQRGLNRFLLVCEEASHSGIAFTQAAGAQYRFSEHAMQVALADFQRPGPPRYDLHKRPATLEDLDILTHILAAAFKDDVDETREQVLRELQDQHSRAQFYLWYLGDEALGCLKITRIESEGYIHAFAVHPRWQGKGIGRQILSDAVRQIFDEKHETANLEVETDNDGALGLYTSCGFHRITSYRYYRINV
jgi:ribosomal protein S18 acetylase RimI-like enzyme